MLPINASFNASLGDWYIGPPKHLAACGIFQRFPFLKVSEEIVLLLKAGNHKVTEEIL